MSTRVFRNEDWNELYHRGSEHPLLVEWGALGENADCPCLLCGSLTGNDCELGACTAVVEATFRVIGLVCWECSERLGDDDVVAAVAARRALNFVTLEVACEIINRLVPNTGHLVETLDDIGQSWLADLILGKVDREGWHPGSLTVELVCQLVKLDEKRRFSELIPRELDEVLAFADEIDETDLRFLGRALDAAVRGTR